MNQINPSKVVFIKLGKGGDWEADCITKSQTLRLGFGGADEHKMCLNHQWAAVKEAYLKEGKSSIAASGFTTQIKEFYEADETVLWITFFQKKLWWCFSRPEISFLGDGTKTRPVVGSWSDRDCLGNLLTLDELSGKLLKTQGYRGTLCNIDKSYVVAKINGEKLPEVIRAEKSITELEDSIGKLVQHLDFKEFELLVDLIFNRMGWQRLGAVGKTEKTLDLDLLSPVTGERAMVQIKSESNSAEYEGYCGDFQSMDSFDRMFYVVHSPDNGLKALGKPVNTRITLLLLDDISSLIVRSGLIDWILKRAA